MPHDKLPPIFPLGKRLPVNVTPGRMVYEIHVDGGLIPIDPKDRGDVDLPCPNCGKPLVVGVSRVTWEKSLVRCPTCGGHFSGKEYPSQAT